VRRERKEGGDQRREERVERRERSRTKMLEGCKNQERGDN
jgi:hypothetical protein